jgi:hypothetical protein
VYKVVQASAVEYFIPTLSCSLGVFPVSAFTFHSVSLIGPLVNVLVLPVVEDVMLWGSVAIVLFILFRWKANIFFLVTWAQLFYFKRVVELFGSLNFITVETSYTVVWVYTVVLLSTLILFSDVDEENFYYRVFAS